jgi:hypothetical protein
LCLVDHFEGTRVLGPTTRRLSLEDAGGRVEPTVLGLEHSVEG